MSENTNIEWCDATVNHWAGCTAVSPACDNCYAKSMAGRIWGTEWGSGKPRHQFAGASDALRALDRKAQRQGHPLKVFHNSLSDVFDNEVPVQWRIEAMRSIVDTPNLIHLLLTKRIGNAAEMLEQAFRAVHGQRQGWSDNVPPNVWIGATICNQDEADRDIPKLLAVPAAKRFLSMEPLLGYVDLTSHLWGRAIPCSDCTKDANCGCGWYPRGDVPNEPALDWVIPGGESGPNARPMHPDWASSLRDQCQAAGVPFLFKQWGEWGPDWEGAETCCTCGDTKFYSAGRKIGGKTECGGCGGVDWNVADKPLETLAKVGKKAAGRLLDGITHDGFPT
nr:phage Gp37/Gp68 family protein [uncultured Rhodoferax sp.]